MSFSPRSYGWTLLLVHLAQEGSETSGRHVRDEHAGDLPGGTVRQADPAEADGPEDHRHDRDDTEMGHALDGPATVVAPLEVGSATEDDDAHRQEGDERAERLGTAQGVGEPVPPEEGEADHDGQHDHDEQVGQVLLGDAHDIPPSG